jgi:hypothetical protein
MLLWLLSIVALTAAVLAWTKTRRVVRRLERLTQSYWELRHEHGLLRAAVERLQPGTPHQAPAEGEAPTFVPLSSLKR